ncbi:Sec-independent protein translocase protein TatB [Aestuariispira ectoiniformans]|uniref:Sec-independent protein translocase protein TatB n=1 Tax=Aestuariispira ectoiniformans TaxID=2775080 RepID=UPI00223B2949|nr:Sec-independent protein translocase protein TatB [Aestuariispira ectoiniformans]
MFDIGWPELMVVAVLTVIVVGPQELPRVLRTVMGLVRKVRMVAGEFQNSMEDIAREADLQDIKKQMSELGESDLKKEIEDSIDPTGEINQSVKEMQDDMESWKAKANIAPPSSIPNQDSDQGNNVKPTETADQAETAGDADDTSQQQAKSS